VIKAAPSSGVFPGLQRLPWPLAVDDHSGWALVKRKRQQSRPSRRIRSCALRSQTARSPEAAAGAATNFPRADLVLIDLIQLSHVERITSVLLSCTGSRPMPMAARLFRQGQHPRPDEFHRIVLAVHHCPCTSGILRVLFRKIYPQQNYKAISASSLRSNRPLQPGMHRQLCSTKERLRPYFDTIPVCGIERDQADAGQQSDSVHSIKHVLNRNLILGALLASHQKSLLLEPRHFSRSSTFCDPERRIQEQSPNPFGLQRCAKCLRVCQFKWASRIYSYYSSRL